jgi:hypothetical protein
MMRRILTVPVVARDAGQREAADASARVRLLADGTCFPVRKKQSRSQVTSGFAVVLIDHKRNFLQLPCPIIFAISRHDLAQSRHDLAQAAIFSSLLCFSHSAAQRSQHSAQQTHAGPARGLWRAERVAAKLQHSAQSAQSWAVVACSFLPPSSIVRQCLKQELHCNWQSAQILAHCKKCSACWSFAGVVCKARARRPAVRKEKLDNILEPPKKMDATNHKTHVIGVSMQWQTTCLVPVEKCSRQTSIAIAFVSSSIQLLIDARSKCAMRDHWHNSHRVKPSANCEWRRA